MPAPPSVEPDASPTTCIEINETWASWMSGRIWSMEYADFWESDQDAARKKASALADIFASGNCEAVMTPEITFERITLSSDLILTATTRTALGAPFELTVNPDTVARYLIHFDGLVHNSGGTNRWLHMYVEMPGQIYFVGNPIYSLLVKSGEVKRLTWTMPTGTHNPGANLVQFQYEVSGAGMRLRKQAGTFVTMHTIYAERVT